MDNKKVPNRVRKPDVVDYILLDKANFKEILDNFTAVLEKHTKKKYDLSIWVDGFNDSFKDIDVFIETIYPSEWKKLSSINVSYYPKIITDGYGQSLSLRFGGYSADGPGLRIEYGDNLDDIVRIAIKQNVDTFMPEFSRNVILTDKVAALAALTIVEIVCVVLIFVGSKPETLGKLFQNGNIFIIISGLLIIGGITYGLGFFFSHRLIPHFEPTDDMNNTRLKKIGKIGGSVVLLLGLVSAIISITQVLF